MTKIIRKETALNPDYLPLWKMYEATKELLQNHVFARQILNAFGSISYNNNNNTLIIEDDGPGFGLEMFLLGKGEQKNTQNAPGQNAEGMKISFLIAARENKKLYAEIPGYNISANIEPSSFGENELVFYASPNDRVKGTRFVIEVEKEVYQRAVQGFGYLAAKTEQERESFSKASIINNNKSQIFVNGVLIETPIKTINGYSYNLIGKDDTNLTNRDRNRISEYHGNSEIWKQVISNITDKKVIANILKNASNNTIETYEGNPYWIDKVLWREVVAEQFGSKVCYATGEKSDGQAKYRKFKVLKTPVDGMRYLFNSLGIVASSEIFKDTQKIKHNMVQLKDLESVEHENIKEVRNLIQKHYIPKIWALRYVDDLRDEFDNICLGLCVYDEEKIYLNKKILSDYDQLFKTLLHEVVHQVSRAEDNTTEFEREWANACLSFAKGCTRAKRK